MKDEYKFLMELCNSHKPEKGFEWEFTRTTTGDGYGTDKSEFVETLLMLVTELDKNFPRRDFLKQVKCHYRSGTLIDGEYSKWRDKEYKKEERERSKEETINYDYYPSYPSRNLFDDWK